MSDPETLQAYDSAGEAGCAENVGGHQELEEGHAQSCTMAAASCAPSNGCTLAAFCADHPDCLAFLEFASEGTAGREFLQESHIFDNFCGNSSIGLMQIVIRCSLKEKARIDYLTSQFSCLPLARLCCQQLVVPGGQDNLDIITASR